MESVVHLVSADETGHETSLAIARNLLDDGVSFLACRNTLEMEPGRVAVARRGRDGP